MGELERLKRGDKTRESKQCLTAGNKMMESLTDADDEWERHLSSTHHCTFSLTSLLILL